MEDTHSLKKLVEQIAAEVLEVEHHALRLDKSFLASGEDSLAAIDFMVKCRSHGIEVNISDVIRSSTLFELINQHVRICAGRGLSVKEEQSISDQDIASLSNDCFLPGASWRIIDLPPEASYTAAKIKCVLEELLSRHPVLQSRLTVGTDGDVHFRVPEDLTTSFFFRDCASMRFNEFDAEVRRGLQSISTLNGPVFGAVLRANEVTGWSIALICHECLIDSRSWIIIAEELKSRLDAISPPRNSEIQFLHWIRNERAKTTQQSVMALVQSSSGHPQTQLEEDDHQQHPISNGRHIDIVLSSSTNESLVNKHLHQKIKTLPSDLILGAVLLAAHEIGWDIVQMHTKFDGRPQLREFSDAVGCFDVIAEIRSQSREGQHLLDFLRTTLDKVSESLTSASKQTSDAQAGFRDMICSKSSHKHVFLDCTGSLGVTSLIQEAPTTRSLSNQSLSLRTCLDVFTAR
nr:nonribosomal peptide synthetase vlms [Quercus suber]